MAQAYLTLHGGSRGAEEDMSDDPTAPLPSIHDDTLAPKKAKTTKPRKPRVPKSVRAARKSLAAPDWIDDIVLTQPPTEQKSTPEQAPKAKKDKTVIPVSQKRMKRPQSANQPGSVGSNAERRWHAVRAQITSVGRTANRFQKLVNKSRLYMNEIEGYAWEMQNAVEDLRKAALAAK